MTMDVDGFLDGPRKTLEVVARSLELAVERHAAEGKAAAEALERVREAMRALGVAREDGEVKGARAKAGGAGRVVRAGEPVGNLDCPLIGCSFGGTTAEGLVSHLGSRHPTLRGQGKARKERRAELVILAQMNAAVAAPAEKVEAWPAPPVVPETVEPDDPFDALLADAIHKMVAVPGGIAAPGAGPAEPTGPALHDLVMDAATPPRDATPIVYDTAAELSGAPLRCPVEAGEDGPCRFDPDGDPDAVYRHLRRKHGDLYGGDDPNDIEWRADAVRKALANAGRDATWEAPAGGHQVD